MTTIEDGNLIGFYASFGFDDNDEELVKTYLWGDNGLKDKLKSLKWQEYGQDVHLILFQFYVKPIQYLRDNLREIENYRRKEKSIGISLIIDEQNFFKLDATDGQVFLKKAILNKLEILKER
jgi:hypothetical protein